MSEQKLYFRHKDVHTFSTDITVWKSNFCLRVLRSLRSFMLWEIQEVLIIKISDVILMILFLCFCFYMRFRMIWHGLKNESTDGNQDFKDILSWHGFWVFGVVFFPVCLFFRVYRYLVVENTFSNHGISVISSRLVSEKLSEWWGLTW